VFTGNGYTSGYDGVNNFSESALKLDPGQNMKLIDWFTPSNWSSMDSSDQDLSSSGPLLVPNTNPALLVGGGKTTTFYVINTSGMNHEHSPDQVVQETNVTSKATRTGPVFWQRSAGAGGPLLFNWGVGDWVKSFAFNGSLSGPVTQGSGISYNPGGLMSLSANGDQSGILWATVVTGGDDQENPPAPGQLRALNPTNLAAADIWNSGTNAARDAYGNFSKFAPPVVVNGKVYVGTWSNQVVAYGLLLSYQVSPTSLPFGNVAVSATSSAMTATVTNTGGGALAISSITIGGSNPAQFSQTNNCGSSVSAGNSCTISVTFRPSGTGTKTATLNVNAGGGAGTQSVTLSGTGVSQPFTVAPGSLPFGNVTVGVVSGVMTSTVTNTGSGALPITSIVLGGNNPGQFSQSNNCGSSVSPGNSCTISVTFKPTVLGAKSATVSVNAGGGAGTRTVALSGTGVQAPYQVSPTSLPFGSQPIGVATAAMTSTVTNLSSNALSITSIVLGGNNPGQFSQSNDCGSSVPGNGSCTISVIFKPTVTGAKSALVSVNAGGGAGTQTITLSGTGAPPAFSVSPTMLTFGDEPLNMTSAPQTITVGNSGGSALALSGIVLGGNNPGQFAQSNDCGSSIAANSSCSINVTFTPTKTGSRTATVTVNSVSAGSQSAALNGNGQ
jgi:hypothetical protein